MTPGDRAVVARVDEAVLGLSICYDLRFPELYRALALAGAEVLAVPGGVHRADRARPLGAAAAGSGDRERRVGRRGRGACGTGGPGAIAGLGPLDDRGSVGARGGRRPATSEAIVRAELDLGLGQPTRGARSPCLANRRPDALPPDRDVTVVERS